MAAASDYLESELLDHVLAIGAYTAPTNVYLALFTTDPTDADTGTEVSGGGYARQVLAFGGTGGSRSNTGAVAFTATGADFGNITHVGIYDALSGGNLLFHGALTTPRNVLDGSTITFGIGDVTVGLD